MCNLGEHTFIYDFYAVRHLGVNPRAASSSMPHIQINSDFASNIPTMDLDLAI